MCQLAQTKKAPFSRPQPVVNKIESYRRRERNTSMLNISQSTLSQRRSPFFMQRWTRRRQRPDGRSKRMPSARKAQRSAVVRIAELQAKSYACQTSHPTSMSRPSKICALLTSLRLSRTPPSPSQVPVSTCDS